MGDDVMVVRFVAGAASALLFAGAGIFWWQSQAHSDETIIAAPPPPSAVAMDALPVGAPGQTERKRRLVIRRRDVDRGAAPLLARPLDQERKHLYPLRACDHVDHAG